MGKRKKLCYIIMPFSSTKTCSSSQWTKIFNQLFKPIIEENGEYECKRSDTKNGSFTKEIVQNLKSAHVVIADITDFNSNVMWELGVRHALSVRTIMVSSKKFIPKIPSDIKNYVVIPYVNSITGFTDFKNEISKALKKIKEDPEYNDNPVFDFLKIEDLVLSSFEKRQIINKLSGLQSELSANLALTEIILEKNNTAKTFWIPSRKHVTTALDHLISTNYVFPEKDYLKHLREIQYKMSSLNAQIRERFLSDENPMAIREEIIKQSKNTIDNLKICMRETHDLLLGIKRGDYAEQEPVIFLHGKNHEDLFDDSSQMEKDSKS